MAIVPRARCPDILGALLSAAVQGLKAMPSTRLSRFPRMADFAQWVSACEEGFWPSGSFANAYGFHRKRAVDDLVEADPLPNTVRRMMDSLASWTGTATELLKVLEAVEPALGRSSPRLVSPRALASRLRRAATILRELGIEIAFSRNGRSRNRTITLTQARVGS